MKRKRERQKEIEWETLNYELVTGRVLKQRSVCPKYKLIQPTLNMIIFPLFREKKNKADKFDHA